VVGATAGTVSAGPPTFHDEFRRNAVGDRRHCDGMTSAASEKTRLAEKDRLAEADAGRRPWRNWGPYVAERAWGTVREDYSANGDAWTFFPHDHARSRVFRWNEDGMAAICDEDQTFVLGLALWNGVDPILKERMFGLTGPEGNHGEDAKEYWWYLDSTPTHSWMTWRYHYPQREFPYARLVAENARRGHHDPEFELVDTGIFDESRYWAVTVDYAKAGPHDLCAVVRIENRGPETASLHVVPTLWFRNTWAWDLPGEIGPDAVPVIRPDGSDGALLAQHRGGAVRLVSDGNPQALFCDNETDTERLWGVPGRSPYPKDGINDHVVHGLPTVNPAQRGTKAALHHVVSVPPGGVREIKLRMTQIEPGTDGGTDADADALGPAFDAVLADRKAEADAFFAGLMPPGTTTEEAMVVRQAVAGLMWGKQYYAYAVERWLEGDPPGPVPPAERLSGRNAQWRHLDNAHVLSMPDPWEYPWYAAWDLAFHCVALAHVDPWFAKEQLLLMLREWYMHPNGQIPAYEWALGDVNPPVHAWAALRVYEIDGRRDPAFLARVFHKLLLNFTWWVNRKDADGRNVFEGGFLGLDNIGPIDRSAALPVAARLEQSDGSAWMAHYALNLLEIALELAQEHRWYEDSAIKFFEHFAYIAQAMRAKGLWDEEDGFFYDVLSFADGTEQRLRVRSMVGLLPLTAIMTLGQGTLAPLPDFAARFQWFQRHRPRYLEVIGATHERGDGLGHLLAVIDGDRLVRVLGPMLDEAEFLSPYGLRSLSRRHAAEPFTLHLGGMAYTVDYEPGESTTALFGGNSNWRGPVWFPVNHVMIEALRRYARFYGPDLVVEHPTGSGRKQTLGGVADDLSRRLVRIFLDDDDGRRPIFGDQPLFQEDPHWHDLLPFHEYIHGDTGKGLGASHQTGWTGLVVDLVLRRPEDPA
jgi:hypothetical protein